MMLVVLGCQHIHALSAHIKLTKVTHILGFATHVLGNTQDYAICHYLVLVLLMLVGQHHLLRGYLIRLSKLVLLIHPIVGSVAECVH